MYNGCDGVSSRFGDGYTMLLRVSTGDLSPLKAYMEETFPGVVLKEQHHNMLQYQLPSHTNVTLAQVFGQLESVRDQLHIEDYSVSQTTLDQVSSWPQEDYN